MDARGLAAMENKELENSLGCMAWFEERTAKLYGLIASRVRDRPIAYLLRIMEHQSISHRDMLMVIMSILGIPEAVWGRSVCVPVIGPVASSTETLIKELKSRDGELMPEELGKIFKELEFIESSMGEETYVKIMAPLVKAVIDSTREEWKRIAVGYLLEEIVREEAFHEKLVTEILRRAVGPGDGTQTDIDG